MKKYDLIKNSEIDLIILIKLFFTEKYKIILFLLISAILITVYTSQRAPNYNFLITISKQDSYSNKSQILAYLLNQNYRSHNFLTNLFFKNLQNTISDKDEAILILKKNIYIKEKLKQFSKENQNKALNNLVDNISFKFKSITHLEISFNYHDNDKGKDILNDYISQAFEIANNKTINDIQNIYNEFKKINKYKNENMIVKNEIFEFKKIIQDQNLFVKNQHDPILANITNIIVKDKINHKKDLLVGMIISSIIVIIYIFMINLLRPLRKKKIF